MSDETPRTDAAVWSDEPDSRDKYVNADFARTLERELAALQARLDACVKAHMNIIASSKWSGTPSTAFADISRAAIVATIPSPESKEQRNKQ